jgi:hypothetical protein
MQVVPTWEEVCYKFIVMRSNRRPPIGGFKVASKSGFLNGFWVMSGEIAEADDTCVCHVQEGGPRCLREGWER